MAFNVISQNSPNSNQTEASPQTPAQSTRERAIAKLMGNAPANPPANTQDLPVRNATQVAPEELSAITSSTRSEGQSSPSETLAPEAPKAPEEPLSNQYALLARREKALRAKAQQQAQESKAREDAFLAKEEALKAREAARDAEYQSKYIPKDRLSQDPLSVLNELGLSYDQLTQLVLNAPKAEDIARAKELRDIQSELKAVKEQQLASQRASEEQQTAAYQQAVKQIRSEVSQLVKTDPTFETINATNSINDVVELIEETYKQDGILLTVEEAANEVENYLVEEGSKIARLSKIQQRLRPAAPAATKPTVTKPAQQQPAAMKTLTNSVASSRPLSARERAILAFKGEKN